LPDIFATRGSGGQQNHGVGTFFSSRSFSVNHHHPPHFAPIYFGEGGQEKSTGLQPGPRSLELRGTLVIKYSRFFVAVNILVNQINIVHNATLHTLALFSRVMRLCKPIDTGVSEVFEVGEKYFSREA
jgi:hypothetical protein